ncbi:MAG TPA: hypothetical protein VHB98_12345 [Chloroflexota bacterium]|nr:hypothetical protein [Chloroflexota bacterium]
MFGLIRRRDPYAERRAHRVNRAQQQCRLLPMATRAKHLGRGLQVPGAALLVAKILCQRDAVAQQA